MNHIDNTKINNLADKFSSPLFIIYADKIRENLDIFQSAFQNKYPKVEVAYSYKVNSLPEVLKLIHSKEIWAEVASGFEYETARILGVSGKRVVFNGPFKTIGELELAIEEGALINVDHLDEIIELEKIARKFAKKIDIGLRLNMEVGIDQLPDRFGFNIESGEALDVVSRCSEKGLLNIIALHVHLTSYIVENESEDNIPAKGIKLIWPKDHGAYRVASEKIVQFSSEITERFGFKIKYIDMGGGFPTVAGLSPYVDAIVEPILEGIYNDELPTLILEPGRAIVSDAGDLITTVVAQKKLPSKQKAIVVDAGINLLPTSFWKYQEVQHFNCSDTKLEETIIYGPLCLQTDIISKTKLPELKAGERLLIKNVGAYNIPQSSTFIYPQPPVLLLDGKNEIIIRNREEIDNLIMS